MSGEFAESTQEPSQRLAGIEGHFANRLDPNVVEYSHLLADRLNPELVPMGFVMASTLLTYDLQTGVNGFTQEPIDSSLVQQSPKLYEALQDRLPALAEFAFSAEFASEVGKVIEKVTGKLVNNDGKSVEELLTEPVNVQRMLAPNTLPEAGEVEVAAELEDGTKLYVDQAVMLLGNEFDPTTYSSPLGSAYRDYSLEMLIHPITALGAANGQYFGLDKEGLDSLVKATSGMTVIYDPERLPDMRKVEVDGKTVYFPTARLLENMGVIRRGVDAPEAANAGLLAFMMRNSNMGDETPPEGEFLPEVELPGQDPFEMIDVNGELPEKGILLEAKMARGSNAVFSVYDYDNLERVEATGDYEYKYLHTSFRWGEDSKARQLEFSYEQPNYFDRDTEPYNRGDEYSYMGTSFANLDVVDLADSGRLLIEKEAGKLGNVLTRLDKTPWKNNLLKGQTRNVVRWFPASDVENLSEAVKLIGGSLLGVDPRAVEQITESVKIRLANAA